MGSIWPGACWGALGCALALGLQPSVMAKTKQTVVYSFCSQQNCTDGANPETSLIDVKGALFGTTNAGGDNIYGSVFALNPKSGAEKIVHAFGSGADGKNPKALLEVKGTLYGTTYSGGAYGYGTVFAINLSTGSETVLYSFCKLQLCADGENPGPSLIDVKGTLYGITTLGRQWIWHNLRN